MAKKHNKRRRKKAQKSTPDDYFAFGPFEIARFGRFNVFRSNLSKTDFDRIQLELAGNLQTVKSEIQTQIDNLIDAAVRYNPLDILKHAFWEMASFHINIESEVDIGMDEGLSLRMIDYMQSIIAAAKPTSAPFKELKEQDWNILKKLVSDIFNNVTTNYQLCRTAYNRVNNPDFNQDYEEYLFKAQIYWCNVRGHRYQIHQTPFFKDVLTPHNDVIKDIYGITSDEIVDSIRSIQYSLTNGLDTTIRDIDKFRKATTAKLEIKIGKKQDFKNSDLPKLMDEVIEENNWQNWRNDVMGRMFGTDLFNLTKISQLPVRLLDEFSWEPGGDKDFIGGDFSGWPLKIWPVFKKPFLKIAGQYYCFELYSLFDNFYRIFQKVITSHRPAYSQQWNLKQKELTEDLPISFLKKILPGATFYKSVYYRWYPNDGGTKDWCECDILVLFREYLFVCEIRAGSFTYTSPATDFEAYIASIKNLALKPINQGNRFLNYLENSDEVDLYDSNHSKIGVLNRKAFNYQYICAISLDSFTEIAAQIQHLSSIGINTGQRPVWCFSIDDLRVYSEIFDNPLLFLHFVEQRIIAYKSKIIKAEDELDHLGLYIKHNLYCKYAETISKDARINWNGYRSEIDKYFFDKYIDPNVPCPLKQRIPQPLLNILNILADKAPDGMCAASRIILNCGTAWRNNIATSFKEILAKQIETNRIQPVSTYIEANICIFCWQEGVVERDIKFATNHTKAVMLITNDESRLLLELFWDNSPSIINVGFTFIHKSDIKADEFDRISQLSNSIKNQRLEKAKFKYGKIGRNMVCPCGSGKKYKNCCLAN